MALWLGCNLEGKEKCGSPEEGSSTFKMQSQKVSGKFISVLKILEKQLQLGDAKFISVLFTEIVDRLNFHLPLFSSFPFTCSIQGRNCGWSEQPMSRCCGETKVSVRSNSAGGEGKAVQYFSSNLKPEKSDLQVENTFFFFFFPLPVIVMATSFSTGWLQVREAPPGKPWCCGCFPGVY